MTESSASDIHFRIPGMLPQEFIYGELKVDPSSQLLVVSKHTEIEADWTHFTTNIFHIMSKVLSLSK